MASISIWTPLGKAETAISSLINFYAHLCIRLPFLYLDNYLA
jgi:hypothetical protein